MDFIESVDIKDKKTLCIDLASNYLMITYIGSIDMRPTYMWNVIEVTEGGGSIKSMLLDHDSVKERLQDLTVGSFGIYSEMIDDFIDK